MKTPNDAPDIDKSIAETLLFEADQYNNCGKEWISALFVAASAVCRQIEVSTEKIVKEIRGVENTLDDGIKSINR